MGCTALGAKMAAFQGLFELLGIPYSHSGVRASAMAMDKIVSKSIFIQHGLDVAKDVRVTREEAAAKHVLEPPYVIKPVAEGSSFGVLIVREGANSPPREVAGKNWRYGDEPDGRRIYPRPRTHRWRYGRSRIGGHRDHNVKRVLRF